MSWSAYVRRITAGASQVEIAAATGVSAATISRWLSGAQGVDAQQVVNVARAYGQPVLGALIEAGYVTPDEAGEVPIATPALDQLTDDELLAELRARLTERKEAHAPQEQGPEAGGTSVKQPPPIGTAVESQRARIAEWAGNDPDTSSDIGLNPPSNVSERGGRPTGSKHGVRGEKGA